MYSIHLNAPGNHFWDAFLLGNGHIGQAATFHPEHNFITLSHISFYSGKDEAPSANPLAANAFQSARRAALESKWNVVRAETEVFMGHKGNYGTALPVGDLLIEQTFPEGWNNYQRTLDLEKGIAYCSFEHATGKQIQTAFCSHPDKVFCIQVQDSSAAGCSAFISVNGLNITSSISANELTFHAQALESKHSNGRFGVSLIGKLRVETDGGTVTQSNGKLCINGASCWRLFLNMETDFSSPLITPALPKAAFDTLLRRHIKDFSAHMGRVQLYISGQEQLCRMVALGRYLLLSGAREDAPLPMSLQGVWNDNVACNIGWTCDMHLDVNTQMNYWLSGIGNLTECRIPLFQWIENSLIPHGRLNAHDHYGLPGWAAEVVSNAWGWAQPYWHPNLSPCPACGAWLAADYMEHYRYTGDLDFLRQHAVPVLREAAEFFMDYLFECNGTLMCGPSISPENSFIAPDGTHYTAALNVPFEIASIRNLFMDLKEACNILNLSLNPRIDYLLSRLPEIKVRSDGSLAEWGHDLPAVDPQHRHLSHLIGLYPYGHITPEAAPDTAKAAQRSIQYRLQPYEQWEDTGWARAMLAFYAARLYDGKQVGFHLSEMLRVLTSANGLIMHPSTRGASSYAPVWELDGNTGFAAAALEALVQSHGNVIRLLPALPPEWSCGFATGLLARGNVLVNLKWNDSLLTEASLLSNTDQNVDVIYRNHRERLSLKAGIASVLKI